MGGMVGGGGGVGGSATGPYAAGGARLGITAAVGLGGGAAGGIGGVVNRESLRDVVTRAGGGGGNEDFVSIYGHHHRVGGVRREEDVSSAPRAGVSFVAYGTCNEAVRLGRGGDDHEHTTSIPAIPVLTAPAPHRDDNQGEIQVWQSRDLRDEESNKEKAAMASQMRVLEITGQQQTERRGGEGEGNELQLSKIDHHHRKGSIVANTNTNTSSSTCQDCGNQAKKDCSHMRCRTCCKSRGFDCSTHVKSTWVPAARRRERQQAEAAAIAAGHPRPKTKRARFISASNATTSHTSTSTSTPPRSSDINSTQITPQDLNFKESLPAEVRAQAVFKCVRVTAIEDGEDEYAYQATVKIRGHIFKGVLYDQRLDAGNMPSNLPDLHLGGRSAAASTSAMIDPSGVYGASGSAILGDPGATSNEVLQVLSTSPKKQCNSYKPLQEHQQFYGSNVRFMDFEISRNESYKMF